MIPSKHVSSFIAAVVAADRSAFKRGALTCAAVFTLSALPSGASSQPVAAPTTAPTTAQSATGASLRTETVAKDLDHPWSIAFLPDFEWTGRALVTERPGRLRIVDLTSGVASAPVDGVPVVVARGQGGLLDVVLDPKFAENSIIYISYSQPGTGGSGIAVAKARLVAGAAPQAPSRLENLQVIYAEQPKVQGSANLGSRLVFSRDGYLYVTVGDRFSYRDDAQDLSSPHGKIMRITTDGKPAPGNPFIGKPGALPEIYTYGHRNPQGVSLNPDTGRLWTQEHGPQGGDEVNVESAGKNYGWPVITYGAEYGTGAKIGEGTAKAGMEQPLTKWVPSIAPSGMTFLTSDRYPGWKGSLFVGALKYRMLVRLQVDGEKIVGEEHLLESLDERIRDVRQGPDGWLYVLTDNSDGRIIRLRP